MLDVAGAAVIVVETEDVDGVSGFAQYHYSGLTFTCSTSGGGGVGGIRDRRSRVKVIKRRSE